MPRTAATTALITACAMLASACATAPPGAPLASADTAPGPDGLICREALQPGSNMMRTICATEAEWRAVEREQRAQSQELMRRTGQSAATIRD